MLLVGVVAIIGSCVSFSSGLPPCTCTRRLSPVCGSDGITYNNQCLLECAATKNPDITLARSGKCDSRVKRNEPLLCPCNAINLPVCGTDGETYANECILDCQKEQTNVELKHQGPCRTKRDEPICACTFDVSPVCGTDGDKQITYSNQCELECYQKTQAVKFLHSGPCRVKREEIKVAPGPICLCTAELRPVCASNGLTYDNPCLFNCAKDLSTLNELHIEFEGICASKAAVVGEGGPTCSCPKVTEPVCASDGRTYANECLMNCESEELTVARAGPC